MVWPVIPNAKAVTVVHEVRGVVSRSKGAPVSVETVLVPDPGPGEALVSIQACGVCHTDLHYREGGINDDFPFLLGHEAAGTVESVGDGVTGIVPGGQVVGCQQVFYRPGEGRSIGQGGDGQMGRRLMQPPQVVGETKNVSAVGPHGLKQPVTVQQPALIAGP